MIRFHKNLTEEKWMQLSLAEQFANVGAEVGRALRWQEKGNDEYEKAAFYRALELLDITLATIRSGSRLKEVARVREVLADYFVGDNRYSSTSDLLERYFHSFNYAARKDR